MTKIRVGDRLAGKWEVLAAHSGGMGVVYILRDDRGRKAAAKTVRDELLGEGRVLRRFRVELSTWISLGRHPNIVEARDTFEVDGRPFLLLEYVEGLTLGELIQAGGPLLPAEALDYTLGLARGMAHAETSQVAPGGRGLVHRDLKPSNVFVTRERRARVSDFGIVKVFGRGGAITDEGMGLGTPYYVSPEQLRDAAGTDGRGDIYSAGAMLYEALTGEPPLRAENIENQVYNILRVPAPSPAAANPAVSAALSDLVLRCLEKDRDRRPPNFAALGEELAALLREEAARPLPAGARLCPTCGHVAVRGGAACPLDGSATTAAAPEARYAPVERPGVAQGSPGAAPPRIELRVDGVEVRPRVPRTGQPMTIVVSVANPGVVAAPGCLVRYSLPDDEAFLRRGQAEFWRGDVAPTPAGAPLRVQWEVVPLRAGRFEVPPPRVLYRDGGGRRREARAEAPLPFDVELHAVLPLVGRAAETATLRDALDAAAAHLPFPVLFLGAPGSGKTRMLDELAALAGDRGFTVLRGRGLERAGQPLRSLHEALAGYFGVADPSLRRDEITARVVDGLDPLFGRDPELVAFLAGFLAGGVPPTAGSDFLFLRFLMGAARSRPTLLVLDDMHFGEFETMDLVAEAAERAREEGRPLLIAMASRPEDVDERASLRIAHLRQVETRLRAAAGLRVHDLAPLGEEDVAALLDAAFPGHSFPTDAPFLAGALRDQTAGNPFFLAETFLLLREARASDGSPLVAPAPGGWNVSPELVPEALATIIPSAVEGAVEGHLARLSPATAEVLDRAAVIGEEFEVDLLAETCGGMDAAEAAIEEMERARLLEAVDAGMLRYRFTHSLLPHVVERRCGEASPRRLRRLHADVADALLRLHGKRGARRLLLRLSRHLLHAGRNREAFRALVQAAGRLVAGQLFPRAASTLAHAEALLRGGLRPPRRLLREFHLHRGETARILGRYDEAAEAFHRAIEIASAATGRADREALGLAYSKMGKVHEARGQITDALYCYGVGMGVREEAGDRNGLANSLVNIGTAYALSGDGTRAREYLERGLRLAREVRNRAARAHAKAQLGALDLREGRLTDARRRYGRAMALFAAQRDRRGQAMALNGMGSIALRRGDLDRAERSYRRALELRRAVGDREAMASSYNNLGAVSERRGDMTTASGWYRRSREAHREVGSRRGLAIASQNLGETLLRSGEVVEAAEALAEAVDGWRALQDRSGLCRALLLRSRALWAAGLEAEADDVREEATREAEASGSAAARALARVARAAALERAGRARDALALLEGFPAEVLPPEGDAEFHLVRLAALVGCEGCPEADVEVAHAAAVAAVERARTWDGDEDALVRLRIVEARLALARGLREDGARAYREAVAVAGRPRAVLRPLLLEALAGLAGATGDPAEAAEAERAAGEVREELRARRG